MSNAEAMTQDEVVQALYQFAAEQMRDGASNQQIQAALMEKGVDAESAGIIVSQLNELRDQQTKEAAQKHMMFGALWCIGGIVVTALTYSAASEGGTYVVAWGAIIFGAVQFFRGVFQSGM
ncbi:hypothetical protein [Gimesia panareensis]|uniref:Uncharacterized protein n=1 Tax=Gimesia panareensis TaxID=2527978 RepID=A0A518FJ12_9PLAN|nr:hypothetical protein [Gimesia panareensis]QDU50369.1 hypothetical protein Pan110_27150 [Gimesia panareensis]QDV16334.1 hypothetical protein Pan153_09610 [Gimesia panareensis]